jgi:ribosomal protein S15P/S13E
MLQIKFRKNRLLKYFTFRNTSELSSESETVLLHERGLRAEIHTIEQHEDAHEKVSTPKKLKHIDNLYTYTHTRTHSKKTTLFHHLKLET